jgi:hypothetical protein
MYFVSTSENRGMKPAEIVLRMGGGVNLAEIYCKHICEYYNVPPARLYVNNKKLIKKKICFLITVFLLPRYPPT